MQINFIEKNLTKHRVKNRKLCLVPNCYARPDQKTILHTFPKEQTMQKLWTKKCQIGKIVTKNFRICSNHFMLSDYLKETRGRKRLKRDAIPTLFMPDDFPGTDNNIHTDEQTMDYDNSEPSTSDNASYNEQLNNTELSESLFSDCQLQPTQTSINSNIEQIDMNTNDLITTDNYFLKDPLAGSQLDDNLYCFTNQQNNLELPENIFADCHDNTGLNNCFNTEQFKYYCITPEKDLERTISSIADELKRSVEKNTDIKYLNGYRPKNNNKPNNKTRDETYYRPEWPRCKKLKVIMTSLDPNLIMNANPILVNVSETNHTNERLIPNEIYSGVAETFPEIISTPSKILNEHNKLEDITENHLKLASPEMNGLESIPDDLASSFLVNSDVPHDELFDEIEKIAGIPPSPQSLNQSISGQLNYNHQNQLDLPDNLFLNMQAKSSFLGGNNITSEIEIDQNDSVDSVLEKYPNSVNPSAISERIPNDDDDNIDLDIIRKEVEQELMHLQTDSQTTLNRNIYTEPEIFGNNQMIENVVTRFEKLREKYRNRKLNWYKFKKRRVRNNIKLNNINTVDTGTNPIKFLNSRPKTITKSCQTDNSDDNQLILIQNDKRVTRSSSRKILNLIDTTNNNNNIIKNNNNNNNNNIITNEEYLIDENSNSNTDMMPSKILNQVNNEILLNSWTGISTFKILDTIEECISTVYEPLFHTKLSLRERLIIVLIKLKTNLPFPCISSIFNITDITIIKVFKQLLPYMRVGLKNAIYMPSMDDVKKKLPKEFTATTEFSNVRGIFGCGELNINLPCSINKKSTILNGNCSTPSSSSSSTTTTTAAAVTNLYDELHKIKFLICTTPNEFISFISNVYSGTIPNQLIFNSENLITKFNPNEDSVMFDDDFDIDTILNEYGIKIVRPKTFNLNIKLQNGFERFIEIPNANIYLKRILHKLKTYTIINDRIDYNLLPMVNDIIFIIGCITNLSNRKCKF